jgi:hypothetical protein
MQGTELGRFSEVGWPAFKVAIALFSPSISLGNFPNEVCTGCFLGARNYLLAHVARNSPPGTSLTSSKELFPLSLTAGLIAGAGMIVERQLLVLNMGGLRFDLELAGSPSANLKQNQRSPVFGTR